MKDKLIKKGFVAMLTGWVRVPALVLCKAGKLAVKSGTRFRHEPDELIPVRASLWKVETRETRVIRLVLARFLVVSSGRNRALIGRIFARLQHNVSLIDTAPLCSSCIAIAMTDINASAVTVNRTENWRTRDKIEAFRSVRADRQPAHAIHEIRGGRSYWQVNMSPVQFQRLRLTARQLVFCHCCSSTVLSRGGSWVERNQEEKRQDKREKKQTGETK
jgi:hypothetical protein